VALGRPKGQARVAHSPAPTVFSLIAGFGFPKGAEAIGSGDSGCATTGTSSGPTALLCFTSRAQLAAQRRVGRRVGCRQRAVAGSTYTSLTQQAQLYIQPCKGLRHAYKGCAGIPETDTAGERLPEAGGARLWDGTSAVTSPPVVTSSSRQTAVNAFMIVEEAGQSRKRRKARKTGWQGGHEPLRGTRVRC
jgi:hypothetical protein